LLILAIARGLTIAGTYANKIIQRLGKLHSDFYPLPAIDTRVPGGIHLEPITETFLTKEDITRLYGQCGDNLHRRNLKQLLEPQTQVPSQYGDIIEWTNKVIKLLEVHYITLSDKQTTILCLLGEPYPKGVIQIALARPPEPE
jgi:hypothetical protein